MLVLGLTGVIGSGKSKVAQMFADLGAGIIDCDVIAHQLTQTGSPIVSQLVAVFGPQIVDKDKNLLRDKLRQTVFNAPEARTKLEQLLHPLIYQQVVAQLNSPVKVKYWIIVVPLLFKSPKYLQLIQRSLVVDCDYSLLVERLQRRSKLSPLEVDAILATQVPREQQLMLADDVIENNRDEAYLYQQVKRLHDDYISRFCNAE